MLTILTAAEIGDQIVNVLERGLAATRAELQKLGVEYQGEAADHADRLEDAPQDCVPHSP